MVRFVDSRNPRINEVIKTIVYAHINQEPNVAALFVGIFGNTLPKN